MCEIFFLLLFTSFVLKDRVETIVAITDMKEYKLANRKIKWVKE